MVKAEKMRRGTKAACGIERLWGLQPILETADPDRADKLRSALLFPFPFVSSDVETRPCLAPLAMHRLSIHG
jgi:hypothetical protein